MYIYQMIFSQGLDSEISQFYFHNNLETRQNFILTVEQSIQLELQQALAQHNNQDLIEFFNAIYTESKSYLDEMVDCFIQHSYAESSPSLFLKVQQKSIR